MTKWTAGEHASHYASLAGLFNEKWPLHMFTQSVRPFHNIEALDKDANSAVLLNNDIEKCKKATLGIWEGCVPTLEWEHCECMTFITSSIISEFRHLPTWAPHPRSQLYVKHREASTIQIWPECAMSAHFRLYPLLPLPFLLFFSKSVSFHSCQLVIFAV